MSVEAEIFTGVALFLAWRIYLALLTITRNQVAAEKLRQRERAEDKLQERRDRER